MVLSDYVGVSGYGVGYGGVGYGGVSYGGVGAGFGYGGDGYCYGGDGYGGDGYGYDGYGGGYGYGGCDGDGGVGFGDGGDGVELQEYVAAGLLDGPAAVGILNVETRRRIIQLLGPDRFFGSLPGLQIVHQDTDGYGHPRQLVRWQTDDAKIGYLQAVHVVCPTTFREYYLAVPPSVGTCQQAVAATFGLTAEEYQPERES